MLLAITQLFVAAPGRAEPALTLHWSTPSAAPSCPDQAWALRRVAEQLGREPTIEVAHGVSAIVAIATRPSGFALDLETRVHGNVGTRTIEGAHCAELSEAAILILTLSVTEASEPSVAATPAPHAPPRANLEPTEAASPTPRPSENAWRYAARAELALALGLWSRLAFGPGLGLGLERGMFRAEISGFWFSPQSVEKGKHVEASLGAARATGCLLWGGKRIRGGPCVGGEFGGVRARNARSGVRDHTWWAALFLGGRLQALLFSRLSLVLEADLIGALARPGFANRDPDTGSVTGFYKSAPLQLRTWVGPELRF